MLFGLLEWIDRWAEVVATAEDDSEWGEQLNALIDAQIESARHTLIDPNFERYTERPEETTNRS